MNVEAIGELARVYLNVIVEQMRAAQAKEDDLNIFWALLSLVGIFGMFVMGLWCIIKDLKCF